MNSLLKSLAVAAFAIALGAPSFARAESSAALMLQTVPLTAGDAEKAGTNFTPPYDPTVVKYVDPPMPAPEASSAQSSPSPGAAPPPSETAQSETTKKDGAKLNHALTPGMAAYRATRDTSYIEPRSWSVSIFKKHHDLIVYYQGRLYKTYRAVFGRSFEPGTKLWEGDRRTPEGVYTIIGKHPSHRWEWFLTLNYPNLVDIRRYDELRDGGVVPVEGGHPIGVGGRIGIHGTDNSLLNTDNVNWTTGCVSVDNQDIVELYKLLPIGTVVIIKP